MDIHSTSINRDISYIDLHIFVKLWDLFSECVVRYSSIIIIIPDKSV
jgi:hypothetical protein